MATVKFNLIGNQIYCDFTISRSNKPRRKTGFTTNAIEWRTKRSRRKNKDGKYNRIVDLEYPITSSSKKLKKILEELEKNIIDQYNTDFSKGLTTNGFWLEKVIKKFTSQEGDESMLFTYHLQVIIDEAPRRKVKIKGGGYKIGLSEGRIKQLKSFLNIILRFEKEKFDCNSIRVMNITEETIQLFEDWLIEQKYSINYVGKLVSNFKTTLNLIDLDLNIDTTKINVLTEDKNAEDIIYLSFEELELIKNTHLPNNYQRNARKWLILGCYVGQRVGDLLNLDINDIEIIQGRKVFQIKQQKGSKMVVIPILPEAELIIESGFPHKISKEKLREYFKEVCRLAGIDTPTNGRVRISSNGKTKKGVFPKWRLIGTHVCRRSFASNFYGIIPTVVLMAITGHSTETMFLKYIGKTNEDLAIQMFEYIDKMPKNQMRVIKNNRNSKSS